MKKPGKKPPMLPPLAQLLKRVDNRKAFLTRMGSYPWIRHPLQMLSEDWHETLGCTGKDCSSDAVWDEVKAKEKTRSKESFVFKLLLMIALIQAFSQRIPGVAVLVVVISLIKFFLYMTKVGRTGWQRHAKLIAKREERTKAEGRGAILREQLDPLIEAIIEQHTGKDSPFQRAIDTLAAYTERRDPDIAGAPPGIAEQMVRVRIAATIENPSFLAGLRITGKLRTSAQDAAKELRRLSAVLAHQLDALDQLERTQPDAEAAQIRVRGALGASYALLRDITLPGFTEAVDYAVSSIENILSSAREVEANALVALAEAPANEAAPPAVAQAKN